MKAILRKHRSWLQLLTVATILLCSDGCDHSRSENPPGWPTITREMKPWSRWWWHGNALTPAGITAEMEAYQKAGIGGLEITPIYGVYGEEDQFIPYLSKDWVDLLLHTLREGERLGIGVDMATGTGWPFGGPWVGDEYASRNVQHRVYAVEGGQKLNDKITFVQQPYLRAVGSQLYEVHDSFSTQPQPAARGTRSEPAVQVDPRRIDITQLKQPITANDNLQALAIDQVVFERSLPLVRLMAYGPSSVIDLTDAVDSQGNLDWTAPDGKWTLYAIFEGWHGKMVERAGPGGEGLVIDHFSQTALQHYLNRFDSAFATADISSLRAFFNDSYEVDDARGAADWTAGLLSSFESRRGYKLENHFPALFGRAEADENRRVLSDYRETIGEMILENFTRPWKDWAHHRNALVRNQAHGSPANILDLYATVDIPEIEGVEALRIKMASSAGNVAGKPLVSSESATWLNEHFESTLFDIKVALDRFLLNGVNHVFYHGTCFSPPAAEWPGHLFYASVHLNPRNSLWPDFHALNAYAARIQSFLQTSDSDNDVLLYFPIYDRYATRGPEMVEHFDGVGRQFDDTAFKRAAEVMLARGYSFDFVSDRQLRKTKTHQGKLQTESGRSYQTLVVPHSEFMPLSTLAKIDSLVEQGATILFLEGLPESIAGYQLDNSGAQRFAALRARLEGNSPAGTPIVDHRVGAGRILIGQQTEGMLRQASVRQERMVDEGIAFLRKSRADQKVYLIVNKDSSVYDGWLPISVTGRSVVVYNPMTGRFGKALSRNGDGASRVRVKLHPEESLILEVRDHDAELPAYEFYHDVGMPVALKNEWTIEFTAGGPTLPPKLTGDSLQSWTLFGDVYEAFSGTATYSTTFSKPINDAAHWWLDLGDVKESAEVVLNGISKGTVFTAPFGLAIDDSELLDQNTLTIKVSNLMANRISDLDKRHVFWRKFYNVNFPARKPENRKNGLFDASQWQPRPSGLLGPVMLMPQEAVKE